ncbi:hypothetical protein CEXT_609941 [Caerostris extrusa]|uniref:Uncharacterized protein n=1 Tax=Caerostris extrusa TaxID=172846 RepID=A0AAV4WE35_CAEEX|nr:hypothetical protein CEXT_609941 [Caerostris extrusa]
MVKRTSVSKVSLPESANHSPCSWKVWNNNRKTLIAFSQTIDSDGTAAAKQQGSITIRVNLVFTRVLVCSVGYSFFLSLSPLDTTPAMQELKVQS